MLLKRLCHQIRIGWKPATTCRQRNVAQNSCHFKNQLRMDTCLTENERFYVARKFDTFKSVACLWAGVEKNCCVYHALLMMANIYTFTSYQTLSLVNESYEELISDGSFEDIAISAGDHDSHRIAEHGAWGRSMLISDTWFLPTTRNRVGT